MAWLSRGHGSALTVQQALPSVFLFVHKLWADRWPSFRLLTNDKKKAWFPPNCSVLKARRQFWQNSAVMSQHVCKILKRNLLGWPTIISCHSIHGGAAFCFCPPLSVGRLLSFSLHRHCMVYIVCYSGILLLNKLLVVIKSQNIRYRHRGWCKKWYMHPVQLCRHFIELYDKVLCNIQILSKCL